MLISFFLIDATFALSTLEHQLVEYIHRPVDKEFNLDSIPVIRKSQEQEEHRRKCIKNKLYYKVVHALNIGTRANDSSTPLLSVPTQSPAPGHNDISKLDQQVVYAEKLSSHFASFGPLFKSSSAIALTESETEYVVTCVKHTFSKHLVFQFNCTNTLNDQLLEDVHMVMQPDDEDSLIQIAEIPAEKLEYDVTNIIYVAFEQQDPEELGNGEYTHK